VPRFVDRRDAGIQLARRLQRFTGRSDVIVICLTRGGVPVGIEVARAIQAPLEVLHFGVAPIHPASAGNSIVLDASGTDSVDGIVACGPNRGSSHDSGLKGNGHRGDVTGDGAATPIMRSQVPVDAELTGNWPMTDAGRDIRGKTVIVVDDGLATPTTMVLAEQLLRPLAPARIVVAAPVGAADVCARLRCLVDECVVALAPFPFRQLSDWYSSFPDDEISDVREICWLDTSEPAFDASATDMPAPRRPTPYLLPRLPSSVTALENASGS
jgi:putative phosphoribosyl transferase